MECLAKAALLLGLLAGLFGFETKLEAGHTRAPYVDGCQSPDGRFVVTAEYIPSDSKTKGVGEWQFTWKDTKQNKTLTGRLQGILGQGHFDVTYAHMFVAPDGETFAVWNGGSFASNDRKALDNKNKSAESNRQHDALADRLIVYKKDGAIVRRVALHEILQPHEWRYVDWVHGNLYWSASYPDADPQHGGEAPRAGMRYYRISPDYTVLEVTIGPNYDVAHHLKAAGAGEEVLKYRRVVRFDLTTGLQLAADHKLTDAAKIPVRPFVGPLISRSQGHVYYTSLDPVRVAGTVGEVKQSK